MNLRLTRRSMKRVSDFCLWREPLKPVVHRIIWFLLDVGAAGQTLRHGWQMQAAKQLGMTRITLHRQVERMVEMGILFEGEKKGEVRLNTAIFKKRANREVIRMDKRGLR